MAITLVGTGATTESTGSISPAYPASYTAVADDIAVVHIGMTIAGSGNHFTTPAGWTAVASQFNNIGGIDGRHSVYLKRLTASESMPTFVDNSAGTLDVAMAWCEVYRGVDTTTAQDASAVASEDNNTTTFTPTGITTVTDGALVISSISIPFNGGDADMSAAQSFTETKVDFTVTNANVTVGTARREVATAGAVTAPTWQKLDFTGVGQWIGVSFALRPGASSVSGSGSPTLANVTSSGSGTFTAPVFTGTGSPTLAATTASGSGTHTAPVFTGTGSPTLAATTASGSGTFTPGSVTGSGTVTLADATSTASGTHTAPVFTGSGSPTLAAATASGSGTFTMPVYSGTGSDTLVDFTASGAGTSVVPTSTGSAAVALGDAVSAGVGSYSLGTSTGSGAVQLAGVEASGGGVAPRASVRRGSGFVPPNNPEERRAFYDLIRRVSDLE